MKIRRASIVRIISAIATSIAFIASLFAISDRMIHKRNPFIRQFPPHSLTPLDTVDIGYNSYYIAGGNDRTIYLGNTTSPLRVLEYDVVAGQTALHAIDIDNIESKRFWAPRVGVLPPFFFFADGAVPEIYKGDVDTWSGTKTRYNDAYFVAFTPVDATRMLTRSVDAATNEYVLGIKHHDKPGITLSHNLLQKQIDGRFCVDGMLLYDHAIQKLVYLYYYRNQFIVADTNLNLMNVGKTIDTVSRAQIKITRVGAEQTFTHAAPPLFVNKMSCVDNGLLFVNSALMSRNEDAEAFDTHSVIDVYDLRDQSYQMSFYLPTVNGHRLHDFAIFGKVLIALNGNYISAYALEEQYF